ncbi:hypothetical protein PN4B1_25940 [Paenibacillus naphthalenovorans]|nr:hypothetical protein PN4B1_25940 [Paenibacillus naphthalenovorans]
MLQREFLLERREYMLIDLFDMSKTFDVNKHGFGLIANEKVVKNDVGTIRINALKQLKVFVQMFGKSGLGFRIFVLQSGICRLLPIRTQQTIQERFFLPITIPSRRKFSLVVSG